MAQGLSRKAELVFSKGQVTVYTNGSKARRALEEIQEDMTLYEGARLIDLLEAVYEQGVRDGRRQVVSALDELKERPDLAHRNPGRPRKATAKKATAKKATAEKATAEKATAEKATAKKATAKKVTAKKVTAKKVTAKKAASS